MVLERVDVLRPEAPERGEPGIELLERLRPQPVEPSLRLDPRFDEPCVSQHAEVLGDRRLGEAQLALDLAD